MGIDYTTNPSVNHLIQPPQKIQKQDNMPNTSLTKSNNRHQNQHWLLKHGLIEWIIELKQIFRSSQRRKIFGYFLTSTLTVLVLQSGASAQTAPWTVPGGAKTCLGFLCGPVMVINGNSPFKDTQNAKDLVILLFLVINIAIAVGLGYKMYEAFRNHQSGEDWQTVAITLVVAILGLVGFNYVVGMFFGIA